MANRRYLPAGGEIDCRPPEGDPIPNVRGSVVQDLIAAPMVRLKSEWQKTFGRPAPLYLRRELFLLAIGYRRQEQTRGGLSQTVRHHLLQEAAAAVPGRRALAVRPLLQPGTTLVREWRGKQHSVEVRSDGFSYEGRIHKSLSEIARVVTGTRWSGPVFFGIKKGSVARKQASP